MPIIFTNLKLLPQGTTGRLHPGPVHPWALSQTPCFLPQGSSSFVPLKEEGLVVKMDEDLDTGEQCLTYISEMQGPQPPTPVRHLQAREPAQGCLLDL